MVDEGYVVKKGQLLAWMSSTERAALLDAARARGEAELKRWESFYKPTPIIAPIDGTVISRSVEPGQTFTNQDAILVMSDRLTVKAQVDETDIAQIALDQRARITLDAYPDQVIPAKVVQIAYDATTVNNVTTYIVDVLPDLAPAQMRSGMTANVSFLVTTKENVLLVPMEAVQVNEEQQFVLTKIASKAVPHKALVQLGLNDGRNAEVVSGLTAGATVLLLQKKGPAVRKSNPFTPFGQKKKS